MQRLVGHPRSVDPEASESLRIVAYFDVLIKRGVGVDGLLRGAAVLSGVVAGAEVRTRVSRRGPEGGAPADAPGARRSSQRSGESWSVWLEREDGALPDDEMIVERLALGVELLEARRRPAGGLETVIDAECPLAERTKVLARLHLNAAAPVRIIATRADSAEFGASSAIVPTPHGILRATLDTDNPRAPLVPGGAASPAGRAGLGTRVRADRAPESWEAAVVALRLADDADPVVDASDLGGLLLIARGYDPRSPHEDVEALARLDPRAAHVLRVLVEAESMRSAAAALGTHHSTVQARHEALTRTLGYDPRTPLGKIRYVTAELLLRLTDPAYLPSSS
jgi:DNA-binding NarL/FixJ family response regulator